jgi:glycosyltransferase involved in cell wall biosynthesis
VRVVLVTETYPPDVNGVAMTLRHLVHGLAGRGHDLAVVCPGAEPGHLAENEAGATVVQVHRVEGIPIPCYPDLRFGLPAGRRLGRAWGERRPDVVHVATEGPLGRSAGRAAERLGIPVTTSFHTNFHTYARLYGYGLLRRVTLGWLRKAHRRAAVTFVPSETVREALAEAHFQNLVVLGRGVDTDLFGPHRRSAELRRSWGVADGEPVAIYVGRLAAEKNLALTLDAYAAMRARLPELRLVLVGDGPLRSRLERDHPEAHFAGQRLGEDLAAHYASGDVFLFASETETFGNVVTEALASGLVVLSYDYAAARRHVVAGRSGVTVPLGDARAYVAAAESLAADPKAWPPLREAARETATTLSWSAVVDAFESTLSRVTGASRERAL